MLNRFEQESRKAKEVIARKLLDGERCVLIAHSQGGIIASNVMRLLAKDKEVAPLCANLEVYTFVSAMGEFTKPHPRTHVEHFANQYDFVARVGMLAYKDRIQGKIYARVKATGHLLNRNYLGAFEKGLYCHGRSRLYSYIKTII